MRYTIKTPLLVSDWQELRRSVFGDAEPIFEEFGGGATYVVEFAEAVTPNDVSPLIRVEILPEQPPAE